MPDMTPAPRRRPLWRLFIMPALLVVAAAAWSGFWFYAASEVGVRADAWRAQEAKAGRIYDCGKRSVAGFPFRFEVRCDDASVTLVSQTAGAQNAFTARLGEILVIAQIYQPKLLIADESMAGLSHSEIDDILALLMTLNERGITIILIEHIMSAVMSFSQRLAVLVSGKKVADGKPQEVVRDPEVVRAYLGQ